MNWWQRIGIVIGIVGGLIGGVGGVIVVYERISTKEQVDRLDSTITLGLQELARCVDSPQYEGESDRAEREPNCLTRVLQILVDTRTQ